jgi:hypothetical protein
MVEDMKKHILFTAGVLLLVGSFAQLSVCQTQVKRPGVIGSSDCAHRHGGASRVSGVSNLAIEHIVVAPGWEKTTVPNVGSTSGEVLENTVVVNGRLFTAITPEAGDTSCILRENWDNTQASAR